jgi:hypothetical protein
MALLNYSTKVTSARTVGEVAAMLAEAGADEIMTSYVEKRPAGVKFTLTTPAGKQGFMLPVQVAAVHKVLLRQLGNGTLRASNSSHSRATLESAEHAERVAWRIAKDWLEAQLALVEASMATLDEVMLPYLLTSADGTTLYQRYIEHGLAALEAGDG